MYDIKLCDYVPAPQPVKSNYIIAAHYYPAWKVGAAQIHMGFGQIKDYPERTPMLGYYDEENPEVTDWEIKWAVEHGVNCFIYCWYRKKENYKHPVVIGDLRCGHGIHEGLFNARYRDKIKFAIMFEAQERWSATDPDDFLENLLPFWTENYFIKENYLHVDNNPVLYIYDGGNCVKKGFGSSETERRTFEKANEYVGKFGFDGINFQIEYRNQKPDRFNEYKERGYTSTFTYCWPSCILRPTQKEIIDFQMKAMYARAEVDPYFFIPCASKQWDPRPRLDILKDIYGDPDKQSRWLLEPESWRELLVKIKNLMDSLPKDSLASRMLLLDNWNEWDEGHYIAPHYSGGFKYLQAVREVFTERDNLPDYRDPQFLGLGPYDRGWIKEIKKQI